MIRPWYKQFWPWFLIALPGTVVVASLFTFYLFSKNSVSLVTDDYYKKGKSINRDLSKLKAADNLNIRASLTGNENRMTLRLNKGALPFYPPIRIKFQHRTLPEKDVIRMLSPDAKGNYRFSLEKALTGPWFIELSAHDNSWKLANRANFPTTETVTLYGQNKE
ncbi:FixH family protein [Veronia pacifica]|uniref:Nitrogen fixation protein FixH n=1 Tax=Veronia pacifica TaxID=1080227 RepID=A0A1C3EEV4_9GAMM|nr:FixH family protein [Veronia pacifica]ODA31749.1 hypothetical protein A8L45_15330 [Veronia pacifica]